MPDSQSKIPVAVSSCLLGQSVRYNGGHCYEQDIVERLEAVFDFIPVCPEMAIGLGTPRTPMQLTRTDRGIQVRRPDDPKFNATAELVQFADTIVQQHNMIYGYIFKSHSPSCGVNNTRVFDENSQLLATNGTGIFAARIIETLPDLPVTHETQLQDKTALEQFIDKVNRYHASHS